MKININIVSIIISLLLPWGTKWLEIISNKFFLYFAIGLAIIGFIFILVPKLRNIAIYLFTAGLMSILIFWLYKPIVSTFRPDFTPFHEYTYTNFQKIQDLEYTQNPDSLFSYGNYFTDIAKNNLHITDFKISDYQLAAKFFQLSSNHGSSMANVALAKMKYEGLGFPKSREAALYELYMAINKDSENYYAYNLLKDYNLTEKENPQIYNKLILWDKVMQSNPIECRDRLIALSADHFTFNDYASDNKLAEYISYYYPLLNLISTLDITTAEILCIYYISAKDYIKAKKYAEILLKNDLHLYYTINNYSKFEYDSIDKIELTQKLMSVDKILPTALDTTLEILIQNHDVLKLDEFYLASIKLEQYYRRDSTADSMNQLRNDVRKSAKELFSKINIIEPRKDTNYPIMTINITH